MTSKVDRENSRILFGPTHAAAQVGCDPSTLREYARRGIVNPIVSSTGRRMFTSDDIRAAIEYRARRA